MNTFPLISVIIPCYNQGNYLAETLDSVRAQTYPYWECIIVNDGSDDNTEQVAQEYIKKDSRFIYLSQENKGLSAARNYGIVNSNGQYILPLDSDDLIAPTYLERAINAFANDSTVKIVYCRAKLFGKQTGEWLLPKYSLEKMLGVNCIFCSALYHRDSFNMVGGYNTNMKYGFEDWDFWLGILERYPTCSVCQIDEILFYYRIRKRSMARQLDDTKYKFLRKQLWLNHSLLYKRYFYSPLDSFEYLQLLNSREYKLGKLLLAPIRFVLSKMK